MPPTPARIFARPLRLALLPAALLGASAALWAAPPAPGKKPAAPKPVQTAKAAPAEKIAAEDLEFFEKKVRPLLAESCFGCHNGKVRQSGLRLDDKAAFFAGGRRGVPVVPGKPEESLLVEAVHYELKGAQMPPTGKLPAEKIAVLVEWVRRGARWPGPAVGAQKAASGGMAARAQYWSFRPIRPVAVPVIQNPKSKIQNPIDAFLLAKQRAKGLKPAAPADRRTLLRRVTYDLTGLPPTPQEVEAFVNDKAPDAYTRVVDRLLASPHYGERWGRHWLDLVRWAETDGHEFDFDKHDAYRYRDYVVRALNADVPFHQFVTEHVAGDLLPQPRRHPQEKFNESLIATGFWHLGEGKHSPVDTREEEADRNDNQIDVFSKAFLGLTVSCARCHDHKFDPITAKDYYALAGYLRSSRYDLGEIDDPAPLRAAVAKWTDLNARLRPVLRDQAARGVTPEAARAALLASAPSAPGPRLAADDTPKSSIPANAYLRDVAAKNPADPLHAWAVLSPLQGKEFAEARAALAAALRRQGEKAEADAKKVTTLGDFDGQAWGEWAVTGEAFGAKPVPASPALAGEGAALRLAALHTGGLADSGVIADKLQGTLRSPNFLLPKGRIWFRTAGHGGGMVRVIVNNFQKIRDPIYGFWQFSPNSPALAWHSMDMSRWAGSRAYVEVLDHGPGRVVIDRVVLSDSPTPPADFPNPLVARMLDDPNLDGPDALAQKYGALVSDAFRAWQSAPDAATPDAQAARQITAAWLRARPVPASADPVTELAQERAKLEAETPTPRRALSMTEGTPEDEYIFLRGGYKNRGPAAPRSLLAVIGGPNQPAPRQGSGRLELARRLVAPSNGLLRRVIVNRLWHHHFGQGLVASVDDFGLMGQPPSHPELLDWLATEFLKQGWSLKKMHRLMVTSGAYRMASKTDAKTLEADPQNRLLTRMPVRRLEAEAIRDGILAVSGRLDKTLYGPSVMPHLTPFMEGRGRPGVSGPLDGAGRRSLYVGVRRNFLTPLFLAFDFPVPFSTMGRRSVSNVPAQALALMNNPFVAQQAEVWAKRALAADADPAARVRAMYQTAYSRPPSAKEANDALAFAQEQAKTYDKDAELRAWSDIAHVLFNVKEFIFLN